MRRSAGFTFSMKSKIPDTCVFIVWVSSWFHLCWCVANTVCELGKFFGHWQCIGHGCIRQGNCYAQFASLLHEFNVSVYNQLGYISIVGHLAEQSMKRAVEKVQTLPPRVCNKGNGNLV